MIDVIRAMDRGIDNRDAQQWPIYGQSDGNLDRTKYVTASEIGYCARKIKFDKEAMIAGGYNPEKGTKTASDIDWGFFERGHNIEAWAVGLIHLGEPEFPLVMTGKHQKSFIAGVQSGTPDGVILPNENDVEALEVKSIDPRTNVTRLPKLVHIDQVMQNLDLIGHNMERSPTGGVLIYIDASNYKKRHVFRVEYNEEHAEKLQRRAEWIMEAQSPSDLPAEGVFKDDCKFCAHTMACSALIRKERNGENYDTDLKKAASGVFG